MILSLPLNPLEQFCLKIHVLWGFFPLSAPNIPKIAPVNMISFVGSYDPWVIPCPSEIESFGDIIPLSSAELSYFVTHSACQSVDTDHCTSWESLSIVFVLLKIFSILKECGLTISRRRLN